jgi:mono/diheme cytochrome c family protein
MMVDCLAAGVTSAANASETGYVLYQDNCSKCHGESGEADNWRGYLYFARNFRNRDWQARMTDAEILDKINKGPRIMPAFDTKLTNEQKSALLRVIREFGR